MKILLIASVVSVSCLSWNNLFAQDASRIKPDPPSVFASTLAGRNPFWPIGFTPSKNKPQQVQRKLVIDEFPSGTFRISSILLGSPPIAVINGGEYIPGDYIPITYKGTAIKVLLSAIGDGFIRVSHEGKSFVISTY